MVNLIQAAIPFFFLLIFLELFVSYLAKRRVYRYADSINDLSMGIIDTAGGVFLRAIIGGGYVYVYNHYRLFEISATSVTAAIACLIFYDLMYYWAHRSSHEFNFLWATHIPHHQSEEYNLSVALRQGVFQGCFFWIFYLPVAFVGFPPALFALMASIDTIYQFWIHTRTIGKLGPLEWVLNTPSHHRVHHAKNPKYIDKNHGGILIIWDRIFGSFVEEEEEPVYGTATPLRSWNPVWADVHYWVDLGRLAVKAPRWRDKVYIWFSKPAWRPQGLEKQGPPAYQTRQFYEKYHPRIPAGLSLYTFFQFVPALIVGIVFLRYERSMDWPLRAGVAGLVFLALVCIGGTFESKRWALGLELLRHPAMCIATYIFASTVIGLDTLGGKLALAAGCAYSLAMLVWVLQYRGVFTRPFGHLDYTPDTVVPIEDDRMPGFALASDTIQTAK